VDRDLAKQLRAEFTTPQVHILEGDILQQAPEAWLAQANCPPPYLVVANLPYYITSAILRFLLEATVPPTRLVVMVQREVARQMIAKSPHSNLLAVSIQFYGTPRMIDIIPAGAFHPAPKVDSAVVRIDVDSSPSTLDPQTFFRVARAGFGTKRKQLRNALTNGLQLSSGKAEWLLGRAAIDPTRRAETLTLKEWTRLALAYAESETP
jgi:16S rRNA (adenine1518-N6/adenine1519-N6)-dimethyltransferase